MSIVTKAMVLNLQIGIWKGYRLDREASAKVTQDAGADSDAARVNKHLVPKESLKDIERAATAVREHFYRMTLPWKDNGDRLLTRMMFRDFIQKHEELSGVFKDAVDDFVTRSYPIAREKAAFRMGELFDPNDYPPAESLRRKFYINTDIDPVSEANDFRVSLDAEHADEVKETMEKAMNDRLGRAMRDVWSRLATVVGRFADKMSTDEVFKESTVRNLEELIEMLPGLNVLDDPDLAAIHQELADKLVGYDPKDLRKKPEIRSEAATQAKEIMERMQGFMSAFGVAE
jgi:hypothetical protein